MVWVGLGFGLVEKNGLGWFGLLNLAETHTSMRDREKLETRAGMIIKFEVSLSFALLASSDQALQYSQNSQSHKRWQVSLAPDSWNYEHFAKREAFSFLCSSPHSLSQLGSTQVNTTVRDNTTTQLI